jgi:hypothetical protein
VLLDRPYQTSTSNTATQVAQRLAFPQYQFAPSSTTEIADFHLLAERLMMDATRMVAMFDEGRLISPTAPPEQHGELVSVPAVLRGGALFVGAFALLGGIGSSLSGVTLIHPLLSLLLIVASVGFYLMSFVPAR